MSQGLFWRELTRLLGVLAFLLIFVASQLFWVRRTGELLEKVLRPRAARRAVGAALAGIYLLLFAYNLLWAERVTSPTHLTWSALLLEAPFRWWAFSSVLGFLLVILFWIGDRGVRLALVTIRKAAAALRPAAKPAPIAADPPPATAPGATRRQFLERTAVALSAAPFAVCAYGFLIERLDIELTRRRLRLERLPKAFEGLRIAQISDLHISPFMSAREIRKVVDETNRLKPDLALLTGDYITWDPSTQPAVVEALAGLRAPMGVFGCLGNHEMWARCENSITRMFASRGIPILRQQRTALTAGKDSLNLMGVDFQTRRTMGHHTEGYVKEYLAGIEQLIDPHTVNILLSHNPNTFDRAAALGIDLSLAGHTHGGQVSVEFVDQNISPARLVTSYVRGWFSKPGGQLYVNRGIGTIGVPIRVGATPEITLVELTRQG